MRTNSVFRGVRHRKGRNDRYAKRTNRFVGSQESLCRRRNLGILLKIVLTGIRHTFKIPCMQVRHLRTTTNKGEQMKGTLYFDGKSVFWINQDKRRVVLGSLNLYRGGRSDVTHEFRNFRDVIRTKGLSKLKTAIARHYGFTGTVTLSENIF